MEFTFGGAGPGEYESGLCRETEPLVCVCVSGEREREGE